MSTDSRSVYILSIKHSSPPSFWRRAYLDETKAKTAMWNLAREGYKLSLAKLPLSDDDDEVC